MKKFLRKKPVMIIFIALAVVFIAVYIGMLVRPISYGFNYVYNKSETVAGKKIESTAKINVKSDKVLRQTNIREKEGEDAQTTVVEYWIYRDDEKIYLIAAKKLVKTKGLSAEESAEMKEEFETLKIDEEEYRTKIKVIKDAKAQGEVQYLAALGGNTIGSYQIDGIYKAVLSKNPITNEETVARNNQAIVFTVVHGIVTVALTTFATLSLVFFVTKKKK